MKSYVGMDVHSKSSVFVIQNERGEELGRGEVPTSIPAKGLLVGAAGEFPKEAIDAFARLGRSLHVVPCAV